MPRSSDPRKLALWRRRFERFSRGQLAVERFCARERVSVASFYYWREKVGTFERPRQERPHAERPGLFQPVAVVGAAPLIRIELPCGTRIELGTANLEVVRTVVGAVSRPDDARNGSHGVC